MWEVTPCLFTLESRKLEIDLISKSNFVFEKSGCHKIDLTDVFLECTINKSPCALSCIE